jgi:hypothetical protein
MTQNTYRFSRSGITAVLAMLYLVIMSSLAVGFYASVNTASLVSNQEVRNARALAAAESGLEFMRFELHKVQIPSGTTDAELMDRLYAELKLRLEGTKNLGTNHLTYSSSEVLQVPGGLNMIDLGENMGSFRAILTQVNHDIRVKVVGSYAGTVSTGTGRAVQLDFKVSPQNNGILAYGVVTRGTVKLSSSSIRGVPDPARGSILTTSVSSTPVTMSGSALVSGDIRMSNPNATVGGNGTIAGIKDPSKWGDHVQAGVVPPEFPTIDPSVFVDYLAGKEKIISSNQSGATLSNIRIKAGTNPQFSGCTINGVILIEAPNKITFSSGSTKITGVIVVDKPSESTSTNSITFSGGGTLLGPENLPASYGALRTMTGSAILAPNFGLTFSGGSTSLGGSVVAKNATFSGGSGGSVNGTVLLTGTDPLVLSGGSHFDIGNASAGFPTGMTFGGSLEGRSETYLEVPVN